MHQDHFLLIDFIAEVKDDRILITIYAPMIYTAPCEMLLMRADTLRGEVVGGLALEISSFVGPCEMARADRIGLRGPVGGRG